MADPPTLGFDARWAPIIQLLQQQQQQVPPNDTDINTYNNQRLPMWKRVGLQAPPLTGPQQSYAMASRAPSSAPQGQNGAALRQDTDFNYSPYTPTSQRMAPPEGTLGNSGAPQANSQAELVGRGGAGWNIYQTTPTWTGSPLSQSPPARDEGDFRAPALNAPQMPNPALLRFAQHVHPLLRQFLMRG